MNPGKPPIGTRLLLLNADHGGDTRVLFEHLCGSLPSDCEIRQISDARQCHDMRNRKQCDVLLLACRLSETPCLEILEGICTTCPDLTVIVIFDQYEPSIALQALAMGAQDCLAVTETSSETLQRAIRHGMSRKSGEQTQRNQTLLRLAGHCAKLGGWTVKIPGYQCIWSDETSAIHEEPPGFSPTVEEALGYYLPEYRELVHNAFENCAYHGTPFDVEAESITAKGRRIWIRAIGEALRDESGRITHVQGAIQDISQQKEAQGILRETAERLARILESITDAFLTLDQNWRVTYVNNEAERLLQCNRRDLLGKVIWEKFPEAVGSISDIEYRYAVKTNRTVSFEHFYDPLNTWFEVKAYPSKAGLSIYFRDITERRRAEEHMRLLETCVARMNDVVLITEAEPIDEPGPRIVYVNEAFERLTGFTRDEALGQTPRILQGPETDRSTLDIIRTSLKTWEPCRTQLLNYTKEGEKFWIEMDIVPVANESGWYTHWVAVQRDITERRNLEEHFRASQRLESVGQLTGGVAHDFNNLLTVILGNTDLMLEHPALAPSLRTFVNMIDASAQKGADLTRRLLAFARRQTLEPIPTDVNQRLVDMDGLLNRTLGEHVETRFDPAPDLWTALIDPVQLESAILNLCINSRDAMPSGGKLTLKTSNRILDASYTSQNPDVAPGEYVTISVSDTGTGIAPELMDRVFEPFFTTKEKGKGTGLGLSMVYGFAKQSGGHISMHSEPGNGTCVRLYLPRHRGESEAAFFTGSTEQSVRRGNETILLVEDDELVRINVLEQLRSLGYQVIVAADGMEAIEYLEHGIRVDLLFTDVVMPGMNGRELADAAARIKPGLKVLFTSGYTEDAIVHNGQLDPGVHLLSKPYRRSELASALRATLDAQHAASG